MPRLLTLLPCEKVLFGENQTVSLITVLAELHFRIFPNVPAPREGQVVLYNWSILCQWQIGLGEEGLDWEQSLNVESPSAGIIMSNVTKFAIPSPQVRVHRMIAALEMLPFLPEGDYNIVARWRKAGDGDDAWKDGGKYPIRVVHDRYQLPVSASTS